MESRLFIFFFILVSVFGIENVPGSVSDLEVQEILLVFEESTNRLDTATPLLSEPNPLSYDRFVNVVYGLGLINVSQIDFVKNRAIINNWIQLRNKSSHYDVIQMNAPPS